MNSSPISSWPRLAVVLGLLAASPVSRAASVTWSGSANDLWSNSANWSAAVPGSADTAVFSGAGNGNTNINTGSIPIFQISFSTANAAAYTIGSLTDSITLNNNGGILMDSAVANNQLINANVVMGPGIASGNYYLTNESTTNNLTVAGSVQGGTTTGTAGVKTLNVGGAGATRINGILDKGGATNLYLVKNGLGTLTLAGTGSVFTGTSTGGITISNGRVELLASSGVTSTFTKLGTVAGNTSTLDIKGGTHSMGELYVSNAVGGTGVVNQTGGDVNLVRLGNQSTAGAGSSGTYNVSAGTLSISTGYRGTFTAGDNFDFNISGTAAVTVAPGAISVVTRAGTGSFTISDTATFDLGVTGLAIVESGVHAGVGTLNLNGGTITAKSMDIGGANSTNYVNFNGTVFKATVENANILSAGSNITSTVKAGGAIFDSNSFGIRLFSDLLHDASLGSTRDGGVTKRGDGVLTINGASTYTGATKIEGGTLRVGVASSGVTSGTLGVNSAVILSNTAGAILNLDSKATAIGSLQGGGASGGDVTLGSATLTTGGDNTSTDFAGVISGTGGLIKNGTGVQTLRGVNTYSGTTVVNAGTLIVGVGGVGSLNSAITVNAGTLGGSGSTNKAVVIGNNTGVADAFIAAGNSVGTFTTTSTLALNSDAVFVFELNSSLGTADQLVANGVSISSASFSFTDLGNLSGISVGTSFTIINNTAAGAISGVFSNLANGSQFTSNGATYQANYAGGTGNDLTLTLVALVPEPSTWALAVIGLAAIGFAVARRKRESRV